MKTAGIPIWLTVVLGLLILLSIASSGLALVGNGMEPYMGPSWGGRNLGIAAVSVVAILLKSPIAYMAAFIGAIFREAGDLIGLLTADTINWGMLAFIVVLLVIWIYGVMVSNKAR